MTEQQTQQSRSGSCPAAHVCASLAGRSTCSHQHMQAACLLCAGDYSVSPAGARVSNAWVAAAHGSAHAVQARADIALAPNVPQLSARARTHTYLSCGQHVLKLAPVSGPQLQQGGTVRELVAACRGGVDCVCCPLEGILQHHHGPVSTVQRLQHLSHPAHQKASTRRETAEAVCWGQQHSHDTDRAALVPQPGKEQGGETKAQTLSFTPPRRHSTLLRPQPPNPQKCKHNNSPRGTHPGTHTQSSSTYLR